MAQGQTATTHTPLETPAIMHGPLKHYRSTWPVLAVVLNDHSMPDAMSLLHNLGAQEATLTTAHDEDGALLAFTLSVKARGLQTGRMFCTQIRKDPEYVEARLLTYINVGMVEESGFRNDAVVKALFDRADQEARGKKFRHSMLYEFANRESQFICDNAQGYEDTNLRDMNRAPVLLADLYAEGY
tara:strand:+ start:415 stop:969 length:555 start_codon:yes stop_codon:yes gene_type:complete